MNARPIVESNTSIIEDNGDHNMAFDQESDEYHLSLNYKNPKKKENIDTRILMLADETTLSETSKNETTTTDNDETTLIAASIDQTTPSTTTDTTLTSTSRNEPTPSTITGYETTLTKTSNSDTTPSTTTHNTLSATTMDEMLSNLATKLVVSVSYFSDFHNFGSFV